MALTDAELAANLAAISRRTPALAQQMPGAAFAAANSQLPVRTAQEIEAFRDAVFKMRKIKEMGVDQQYAVYQSFDKGLQDRLQALGFRLPHREDPGFFERWIGRPIGLVTAVTLGNTLEFANKAFQGTIGNVSHWFRAAEYLGLEDNLRDRDDPFEQGNDFFRGFTLSPAAWSRAWEQTADGDSFIPFPEERLRHEGIEMPRDMIEIAADMAREFSEAELIATYGDRAARAFEHPLFEKAVQTLSDGRISFGRSMAENMGIKPGTEPFQWVSGSVDAFYVWHADPFNKINPRALSGGFRAGGREAALRGAGLGAVADQKLRIGWQAFNTITDAREVRVLADLSPDISRAYDHIATVFQTADESADGLKLASGVLARDFPALAPLVDDLVRANPRSRDEVIDFFAGEAGWQALARSKAARYNVHLHESRLAEIWRDSKGQDATRALVRGLNENPLTRRSARMVQRLATRVPHHKSFDPEGPEAFKTMRDIAKMALPEERANEIVTLWSASNTAGKRRIYLGMIDEMGVSLGVDKNPDLKPYWDQMLRTLDESDGGHGHLYGHDLAGNELGIITNADGTVSKVGVLDTQVENVRWHVPDYKKIADATKLTTVLRHGIDKKLEPIGGAHIPSGWINRFMDSIWKPGKVLTPIQGFRQGGEELIGYALEKGIWPTLKSRLSVSAQNRIAKRDRGERTLIGYLAANTKSRLGKAAAPDDDLVDAASALHEISGGSYVHDLIDPHNRDVLDNVPTLRKFLDRYGQVRRYSLKQSGLYTKYERQEDLFSVAWQGRLAELSKSAQAQVAIKAWRKGQDADEAVYQFLASPQAASLRSKSLLFKHLEETQGKEAALREWARQSTEAVRSLTHRPDGTPIDAVILSLRKRKPLTIEDLEALPFEARPLAIAGRSFAMVGEGDNLWRTITNAGFDLVDRQQRWLAREPMMLNEFARHRKLLRGEAAKLEAAGLDAAEAARRVDRWAYDRAAEEVYKHIDDPRVRSQFAQQHRALFPFWYAQDLFIRRWGSRILRDPTVARRAQLIIEGFDAAAFTERDEDTGELMFHFPAAGWAMNAVTKPLAVLTGQKTLHSLPVSFSGNAKYVIPGLGEPARPGVGPLVSVPLRLLRQRFPEIGALAETQEFVEGEFSNQPILRQLMPSVAARLITPFNEEVRAANTMAALQYLEASGHGLPDDATEEEIETFIDRVRSASLMVGVVRGIFGSLVPGGAKTEFAGDLSDEFKSLLKVLPIDEAVEAFLRRHPDGDPYTVFSTHVVEGAQKPLPPTRTAEKFYQANQAFMEEHGAAATWFMPSAPEGFDPVVWREQLARGLRIAKTPSEFYMELKVSAAADEYYRQRDALKTQLLDASPLMRDQLEADWDAWRSEYLAAHPALARHIALGGDRARARSETMARLAIALQDPRLPSSPHTLAIKSLIETYEAWRLKRAGLEQDRSRFAGRLRDQADLDFLAFGSSLTDPVALTLFNANVRPELRDI